LPVKSAYTRSSHASSRRHSSSVNSRWAENISACPPTETVSTRTPNRASASRMTCLPASTPIEPVIVPALATTASAGIAR
jgi:hypothetical protein